MAGPFPPLLPTWGYEVSLLWHWGEEQGSPAAGQMHLRNFHPSDGSAGSQLGESGSLAVRRSFSEEGRPMLKLEPQKAAKES